jgi:hypothetical protein
LVGGTQFGAGAPGEGGGTANGWVGSAPDGGASS